MANGQGLRLGRVAGIDVHADPSLVVIVFLVTVGLAGGLLPTWHPGWSPALRWVTALAGALLFFASILAHELSHAVVARRKGIGVSRITLFLFGGLAHMEHEPPSWRSELLMAAAGPATSLVLGALFTGLGAMMAGGLAAPVQVVGTQPLVALRGAGVVATILLWLGPVNVMLGLFNMVPGFPLDGGRVLRAVIWGATGNLREATRWASLAGRGFSWLLMGSGIAMGLGLRVPFFGTGFLNGLWLILIGWFLNNAALMGYRQVVLREALDSVPVARLMRTRLVSATPDMLVSTLVDEHLMSSGQRSFPVEEDGRFVGLVCLRDLYRLPREAWGRVTVGEVMVGLDRLATVTPQDAATEALAVLDKREVNQLPVLDEGRFAGLVRREDVLRWLTLQSKSGRPAHA